MVTPFAKRALPASAPSGTIAAALHRRLGPYDAGAVAGSNPYRGPLSVYEQKLAEHPPPPTPRMIATADATPRLVRHFETTHPDLATRRVGLLVPRDGRDWIAARPTALVSDGGLLIVTTTREELAREWFSPYGPEHHRMPTRTMHRVLHDLTTTGASHAYVVCEIQGVADNEIVQRWVGRDEPTIEMAMRSLYQVEENFWIRHVRRRIPPEPAAGDAELLERRTRLADPLRSLVATDEELLLLRERLAITERIGELEGQVATIDQRVKNRMGTARALIAPAHAVPARRKPRGDDEVVLVRWGNTGGFCHAQFTEDHPDVAGRFSTPQPTLDIDAVTSAEPKLAAPYFIRPFVASSSARALAVLNTVDTTEHTTVDNTVEAAEDNTEAVSG